MKLDHRHYVPVVRWKRAEAIALRQLPESIKAKITPFIELPPTDFDVHDPTTPARIEGMLPEVALELLRNWGRRQLFFDLGLLDPSIRSAKGVHPVVVLSEVARSIGLSVVPVTALTHDGDYQGAVRTASSELGVCIRLSLDDANRATVTHELYALLTDLHVSPEDTDLVLDYGQIDSPPPRIADVMSRLPSLPHWRTLTVTAGAFPRDLTGFTVGQHLYARADWRNWQEEVTGEVTLARIPTYGDYTIQHAIFSEPPERANFSASIRQATDRAAGVLRARLQRG